jgi:hypothetical protein
MTSQGSRVGAVSMIAGLLVAVGAFVVLQAWTPPMFILEQLGATSERRPAPIEPRYALAVTSSSAGSTPLVTAADVVAARVRGGGDGSNTVELELAAAARERLAAHAAAHPADPLAIAVDGKPVASRPAAELRGPALVVPAGDPLPASPTELAGHFGGAPVPVPGYVLAAARLVPALIAGFVALALVRILTRR